MLRLAPLALLLAAAGACAQQPPNPQGQQQEHRGPPQEAFDACKGKKEGDAAQMKTPRGDAVAGTCRMVLVPGRASAERTPPRERPPVK
jgi:hypothetical protein